MPKCNYCGKIYEIPKGLTLVMNSGKINHLCSSKCRKNMKMKRRKVNWIKKGKTTAKELRKEIKAEIAEEHHEKARLDQRGW